MSSTLSVVSFMSIKSVETGFHVNRFFVILYSEHCLNNENNPVFLSLFSLSLAA